MSLQEELEVIPYFVLLKTDFKGKLKWINHWKYQLSVFASLQHDAFHLTSEITGEKQHLNLIWKYWCF